MAFSSLKKCCTVAGLFLGLLMSAETGLSDELAAGVRGVATRAPEKMTIDGNLAEFKDAFCTPVEYFHKDLRNRAAQFFYMWDDDAFYAGLRTLDEKQANPADDNHLWGGDAVEWYFDTRRGSNFRNKKWEAGAVHCYWTGYANDEVRGRFCLRPGYLDAIKKIGIEVAARKTAYGAEVEFKLPWANFPNFKPKVGEVIGLDAELCYSDGGPRVFRTFAYGSPLSVSQPASLAKVQLVERLERSHWRQCGAVMMPMRVDVPWSQKTKGHTYASIALPPNHADKVGSVRFAFLALDGKPFGGVQSNTIESSPLPFRNQPAVFRNVRGVGKSTQLSSGDAKREVFEKEGNFARATASWPIDAAPPGAHFVMAIVYDKDGYELTRVAPRLVSVNMQRGY